MIFFENNLTDEHFEIDTMQLENQSSNSNIKNYYDELLDVFNELEQQNTEEINLN